MVRYPDNVSKMSLGALRYYGKQGIQSENGPPLDAPFSNMDDLAQRK